MTDAELLATAMNRQSFIEIAQRLLIEEVHRRDLDIPATGTPKADR